MPRIAFILFVIVLATATAAASFLGTLALSRTASFASVTNAALRIAGGPVEDREVSVVFAGDVMLSRYVGTLMRERGDWTHPFLKIASTTRAADIAFGNLENPISIRGENVGSKYSFRANPNAVKGLIFAGFDVVSLANNHIGDYGDEAVRDTLSVLGDVGIKSVGVGINEADAREPAVIERKGQKFAFLGYTNLAPAYLTEEDARPAVAPLLLRIIKEDVERAKNDHDADFIIVTFHWGVEYETSANGYQRKIARAVIDAGADMVIGHHPHVVQPGEWYKDGYIAYSLGNFVFDQNFSEETSTGELLRATVKNGKLVNVSSERVKFTDTYQPYIATSTATAVQ